MGAIRFSEKDVANYKTTLLNILKWRRSQTHVPYKHKTLGKQTKIRSLINPQSWESNFYTARFFRRCTERLKLHAISLRMTGFYATNGTCHIWYGLCSLSATLPTPPIHLSCSCSESQPLVSLHLCHQPSGNVPTASTVLVGLSTAVIK